MNTETWSPLPADHAALALQYATIEATEFELDRYGRNTNPHIVIAAVWSIASPRPDDNRLSPSPPGKRRNFYLYKPNGKTPPRGPRGCDRLRGRRAG
jgi:hypothetical protein